MEKNGTPQFPILVLDDKYNYFYIIEENFNELESVTYRALIKNDFNNLIGYDKNLNTWFYKVTGPKIKRRWYKTFLAYTLYDPVIKISYKWIINKKYQIRDLKENIIELLKKGNEVITQFNNIEDLINIINNCNSFEEITKAVYDFTIGAWFND